jgi:hypothetical protein
MCILRTIYATKGYAVHYNFLTDSELADAAKLSWITLILAIAAHSSGRLSVALLIYKLQYTRWRSVLLFFIMGTIVATALMGILITIFECLPPQSYWEGGGTCISPVQYAHAVVGAAAYWCCLDFVLASLPITIVWNLQLPLRRKVLISILLGLGFL